MYRSPDIPPITRYGLHRNKLSVFDIRLVVNQTVMGISHSSRGSDTSVHTRASRNKLSRMAVTNALAGIGFAAMSVSSVANAQSIESFSLTGIKPLVNEANEYIKNRKAAEQLGKALFWDIAAGSDGQSCASCHFVGGADNRIENQIAPGHDNEFDVDFKGEVTGPNKILTADHFPFLQQSDVLDKNSEITQDLNDRFSSQGTFNLDFIENGDKFDICSENYDDNKPFHHGGLIYRIVEPRNTPTNINAGYYFRLALDGRARNLFTGPPNGAIVNTGVPSGPPARADYASYQDYSNAYLAYNSYIYYGGPAPLPVSLKKVALINSALARQSTAPPLDNNEMTCAQRTFIDIARKLIDKQPLQFQKVHPEDSLLADKVNDLDSEGKGLTGTYRTLIQEAFHDEYWNDNGARYSVGESGIQEDPDGVTQLEHNFLLFWGLSMQAYQAILVSDNAPIDKGAEYLSESALRGFDLFTGKGKCADCHTGPLLADSTTTTLYPGNLVNNTRIGNGVVALMDRGFHNIGVSPTSEDLGLGGNSNGIPFSHTKQYIDFKKSGRRPNDPEVYQIEATSFDENLRENRFYRPAIDGAFKTTTLRNVGLTPPYFHDGSYGTLKQVVQFYNRGGNVRGRVGLDTTGFDQWDSNLSFNIQPLGLTDAEVDDMVEFLLSLTDEQVACHQGVFDHPELPLTRGHQDSPSTVAEFGGTAAEDYWSVLPAVGRQGLEAIGKPCFPNTGRLFGEAQTALNVITDFQTPYFVPEDKPDSTIGFEPDNPILNDPWKYCAAPATRVYNANRICYFPELKEMEVRFISNEYAPKYKTEGPSSWCLPHMFGLPFDTQGICEYRPLVDRNGNIY